MSKKTFFNAIQTTIGANFLTKELNVDGSVVQLQLWDTKGAENFNQWVHLFIEIQNVVL